MIPSIKTISGNHIPKVGLGTWMMGGGMHHDSINDDVRDIESIKYAIGKGITWIRTAQNYADGYTLKLIAKAISGLPRSSYQICLSIHEGIGVDISSIEKHTVSAAKILGVDYLDMVIIGGINPDISIKTVSDGLCNLKKIGLTKDIGVGNYRMEELKIMEKHCGGELAYNELQYSLVVREVSYKEILKYMNTKNLVLGAYRPLHLGQLAQHGISLLDNLSEKYSRTPAEISLKWLVSQEGVMTFPKSSKKKHIDAIADLYSWSMSKEDQLMLTNDFPITVRNGDCIPPVYKFTI